MITGKQLYIFSFSIIFLSIFIVGGFFQFFFGFSNTGMTGALLFIMFINYLVFVLSIRKIVINIVILIFCLYLGIILLSGIVNQVSFLKILVYLLFPLLPLGIYLFFYINSRRKYVSVQTIFKIGIYVSLIQLPVLLIQRYFFGFFIQFNKSGQTIAPVDFLYGTFFLKSDHSLGFFLILMISVILLNINHLKNTLRYPFLVVIYLSITVLIAESNISKGFLAIIWILLLFFTYYKKLRKSKLFIPITTIIIISTLFAAYSMRNLDFVQDKIGGRFDNHFGVEKSYRFYKKKTAKREHIVVTAINKLDTKIIGDGPYSYFDITTGKFNHTIHFSQIIWTYFDLGLAGLVVFLMYLYYLIRSLRIKDSLGFLALLGICLVYAFYTNIFSEIAIIYSIFLIVQKPWNESDNYTISRLEEK